MLSPREKQIFTLVKKGHSNHDIAMKLQISENTVVTHIYRSFKKLGVKNRTQAIVKIYGY